MSPARARWADSGGPAPPQPAPHRDQWLLLVVAEGLECESAPHDYLVQGRGLGAAPRFQLAPRVRVLGGDSAVHRRLVGDGDFISLGEQPGRASISADQRLMRGLSAAAQHPLSTRRLFGPTPSDVALATRPITLIRRPRPPPSPEQYGAVPHVDSGILPICPSIVRRHGLPLCTGRGTSSYAANEESPSPIGPGARQAPGHPRTAAAARLRCCWRGPGPAA